jgi:hypothetical protein
VSAVSAVVNSVAAQRAAADKLAMKMLLLEAKARQRASYGTKTELILSDRKQRDAQEMIQR